MPKMDIPIPVTSTSRPHRRWEVRNSRLSLQAVMYIVIRYICMKAASKLTPSPDPHICALAEFRYTLRRFLHFSEEAATAAGIAPQQHQLLLQIAGAPDAATISVGYLAERLALRHHSAVELCNRCEQAGLIHRVSSPTNRRSVMVTLTRQGNRILRDLSANHARELNELGPRLVATLRTLTKLDTSRNTQQGGGLG
jgi:DNA-binding MarR family transcriptional regulator